MKSEVSLNILDYDFHLPKSFIAQEPIEPRDHSKLMVLRNNVVEHRKFYNIIDYLTPEDTIVLNNTKVIPAKLYGKKETGGKVQLLITSKNKCLIYGKNIKCGTKIYLTENIFCEVLDKAGDEFSVQWNKDFDLSQTGRTPLPPYIKKDAKLDQYNTIYASQEGSIAAPTAGLHFTLQLLEKIKTICNVVDITLHIGYSTFKKITNFDIGSEFVQISEKSAKIINETKGKVIAVGTSTVRALESACKNGKLVARNFWCNLFIYPPYNFKSKINALITNFHLPKSPVLLLVCAFVGKEYLLNAYKIAIQQNYRFYSFGDAMLIIK